MPRRLYIVVDLRADHSLRIPRPELTRKIGSPNACNGCHTDQTTAWAEDAVRDWYGEAIEERPHFGQTIQAGRSGAADAEPRLLVLAADTAQPGIARATALDLLGTEPDPTRLLTIRRLLQDPDDLVRAAAVRSLESADAPTRLEMAFPVLDDRILSVRLEAARVLAPLVPMSLTVDQQRRLQQGLNEYRSKQ